MAERGAHLTGTTYVKPTIFEIVAQESLASTLEPAFKKFFSFLITCNPERHGRFEKWSNEAYLIFHGIFQNIYLKNYVASFSETFYGLRRINSINSEKLSKKKQKISLILLVLYPYIKSKVAQWELENIEEKLLTKKLNNFIKTQCIKAYKKFQILYGISEIFCYLAYISNYSPYSSLIFNLLSITMIYSHMIEGVSTPKTSNILKNQNSHPNDCVHMIQQGCMKFMEAGAFFIQFINWWNQDNYHTNMLSLPLPPPPAKISVIEKQHERRCPICLKTPNIPTVLIISGYVFCYSCILKTIHIYGKCPVTCYSAREDDLFRVYIN